MEREATQLKTRWWDGSPCSRDAESKQTLGAVCGWHRGKEGSTGLTEVQWSLRGDQSCARPWDKAEGNLGHRETL